MRLNCGPIKKPFDSEQWHRKFVWWPKRLQNGECHCLTYLQRRLVVDAEGNWAGGYMAHWEYTL